MCLSIAGVARISPAPTIHEGRYWLVEHAYPTALVGWLVLVLKRHAEALHGISRAEGVELGLLQWAVSRALHAVTGSLKEYSVFFAEKPGFGHVHVHLVPRAHDLDPELRSGGVFAYLRVGADEAAPPAEVQALCARISLELRDLLEGVGAR